MPYLNALSGTAFGKRYELTLAETIMGRHPDCDIVLDAGAVSRQHAKVVIRDGQFFLEDLKSRNGTFLNGRLMGQPTALQDGDLIRICDLELSYHDEAGPDSIKGSGLLEGSSVGVLMIDDPEAGAPLVTNKLDMRSGIHGTQFAVSSEVKLAAMIDIMQSLGRAVSLDEVLPKVLDGLFKIFVQADRGFILLREADGSLQPKCIKARRADQEETVRISRTVIKQIMESKEAIISLDASSDERFEMSQSVADFRIRSMIVAPLLNTDGDAIGAIQIDTLQQRNKFEAKDLEVLVAVTNQAAITIENAQLHDQVVTQKLVEQDLLLAKQVQQAFLPKTPPDDSGYQYHQYYQAANQIGGDYFDYIRLAGDRIAIAVADVVGHGVAAAMFMAKLSAETRFAFASTTDPAVAMAMLNHRLTILGIEKMVTMCVVVLKPSTGEAWIVNAGHMPPILRRKDGTLCEPSDQEAGLPLGIIDDMTYEVVEIRIEPGDCFTMYTDGIFEAPNGNGEQFSINRLRQHVTRAAGDVQVTGSSIVDSVRKHVGTTPQEDDMCLVVVGRS